MSRQRQHTRSAAEHLTVARDRAVAEDGRDLPSTVPHHPRQTRVLDVLLLALLHPRGAGELEEAIEQEQISVISRLFYQ
jgi:hypothetical protein